jgi:triphosphatase
LRDHRPHPVERRPSSERISMEELELKLAVPPEAVASLRRALLERGARSARLRARYFDTPEDELACRHVALRLRKEGRRWVQTLKASGDSPASRFEHNVALGGAAARSPRPELARHAAAIRERPVEQALASIASAQERLVVRYATDVQRWSCPLQLDGASVEAALDVGWVVAGERRQALAELEFEWLDGRREALFELVADWAGRRGLWLDALPKSARGRRLAQGLAAEPALRARPIALEAGTSGGRLLRIVLGAVLEQVLANATELALGSSDDEHVHQLRVGLRRLRTALRELAALSRRIDPAWDTILAQTAQALGALRDQQTTAAAVEPMLRKALAPLTRCPSDQHGPSATEVVKAQAFQRTLVELLGLAASDEQADLAVSADEALAQTSAALERLHRQVRRDGKVFASLPTELQHRVRKRLKRLRYLAEFVAALWPHDEVERYLGRIEGAQDALGRHNDLVVAAASFRDEAARDPRALFAAGYLQASFEQTARQAQRTLGRAMGKSRFWTSKSG